VVARQLLAHLNSTGLLPRLQSAYCTNHATETAVLKVFCDILLAIDAGDLLALVFLDLCAAFNTADHGILLQRLDSSYKVVGTVLGYIGSNPTCQVGFSMFGSSFLSPRFRHWCYTVPPVLR